MARIGRFDESSASATSARNARFVFPRCDTWLRVVFRLPPLARSVGILSGFPRSAAARAAEIVQLGYAAARSRAPEMLV